MKRYSKVFCNCCACLFVIKGEKPLCVATAEFVEGPLRNKIDVVGLKLAEKRNLKNNCDYRKNVSLRAWEIKRWLLGRMRNGGSKVEAGNLSGYTIEEEARQKNKFKVNGGQEQGKKTTGKKKPEFPKGSPGEGTYNSQSPASKSKTLSKTEVKSSTRVRKRK